MNAQNDIVVDAKTGKVDNASLWERLLIGLHHASQYALAPVKNVGISRLRAGIGRGFSKDRYVRFNFGPDMQFRVPANDYYWSRFFIPNEPYEPEIDVVLKAARGIDYALIDCGANFGYWSLRVASEAYGRKDAIAIEASQSAFDILRENAELQGNRFAPLHRAILDKSGEEVEIYGSRHAGRSILKSWQDGQLDGLVHSITIDDLVSEFVPEFQNRPVVLKLDVEGVETLALKGASKLLDGDILIIYEETNTRDVGEVSQYVFAEDGFRVFFYDGASFIECASPADAEAIREKYASLQSVGLNFFAFKGGVWAELYNGLG